LLVVLNHIRFNPFSFSLLHLGSIYEQA